MLLALLAAALGRSQQAGSAPMPEIHQLMHEVQEHQRQLDKVRENYTFTSTEVVQDIDGNGQVKKTETRQFEHFFVNGHRIYRLVQKDGKRLDADEEKKETERVTKLVEKAQNTPPGQSLEGHEISITQMLEIMDVRNERREMYHGRASIVFDFVGRKDAKTHGLAEDASKKLQGTLWVDEADRQVAHLDVSFDDNFKVGGGLVATVEKGSSFHLEQGLVNGELWLPVGVDGTMQARLMLVKGIRQRFSERDTDFKRFHVEAQTGKDAKAVVEPK